MVSEACVYADEYGTCELPIKVKKYGWCTKHYSRWIRYGDPSVNKLPGKERFIECAVDGCLERAHGKGWCNPHYQRWYQLGDPEALFLHEQQRLDATTRTEKECPRCGEVKMLDDFGIDQGRLDGRTPWCRICKNKATHEAYVATHPNWSLPMTPGERLERERQSKREYAQRHPEVRVRNDVKRRMRIAENYVEDVDPLILAEIHEWICKICLNPIDSTLPYINPKTGKPHEGYRTIDHIVAISRGGEHSYANTRIAHWICNVRRWTGEREVA